MIIKLFIVIFIFIFIQLSYHKSHRIELMTQISLIHTNNNVGSRLVVYL